jgi:hypothetical protein
MSVTVPVTVPVVPASAGVQKKLAVIKITASGAANARYQRSACFIDTPSF